MSGKKFNVNEVIKGISKAKSEGFKEYKDKHSDQKRC